MHRYVICRYFLEVSFRAMKKMFLFIMNVHIQIEVHTNVNIIVWIKIQTSFLINRDTPMTLYVMIFGTNYVSIKLRKAWWVYVEFTWIKIKRNFFWKFQMTYIFISLKYQNITRNFNMYLLLMFCIFYLLFRIFYEFFY